MDERILYIYVCVCANVCGHSHVGTIMYCHKRGGTIKEHLLSFL